MAPKAVELLEDKSEGALAETILKPGFKNRPRLAMHLMARAAVTVYEAENGLVEARTLGWSAYRASMWTPVRFNRLRIF